MNERTARQKFWQILSAVEYCHNRNIVHRDLKVSKRQSSSELNGFDRFVSSSFRGTYHILRMYTCIYIDIQQLHYSLQHTKAMPSVQSRLWLWRHDWLAFLYLNCCVKNLVYSKSRTTAKRPVQWREGQGKTQARAQVMDTKLMLLALNSKSWPIHWNAYRITCVD